MEAHPEHLLRHIRRLAAVPAAADTDDALLERFARRRDEDAFAALVGRYGPLVLGVCRRVLGDRHEAEDAAQATFLVLARKAAAIGRPDTLAAWLHGTARRVALKCRRAEARRRHRETRGFLASVPRPQPDPLDELTARELLWILDEEVRRLPEVYRLPVLLCCLEGRSQEEAARYLGWTPGSLKGRLERGRARLHARLARRGLTLAAALAAGETARHGAAATVLARRLVSTVQAATQLAAGQPVAPGLIPAHVLTLMQGVLNAMLRARLKVVLVALLTLSLLGTAAVLLTIRAPAQEPAGQRPAPADLPPAGATGEGKQAGEPDVYALILIEERESRFLPDAHRPAPADNDSIASYRRTQAVLVRSRPVLRAALRRREAADLAVLKGSADPLRWLEKHLRVEVLDDTGVLRVSVGEGGEEERAALANAVARAYVGEAVAAEEKRKQWRQKVLEERLHLIKVSMNDRRRELDRLREELGASSRSLKQQFDGEDLAERRKELQRVHLARVAAQARLNYRKAVPTTEDAKAAVAKLEEEAGVLAEQEKLLKAEIAPLAEAAAVLAHREATWETALGSLREEIAAAELMVRRITSDLETLQVERCAEPRVRLLQEAEAPRRGK
jgi:RNA polymerase sigma factor (sigma-70 family)